MLRPDTFRAPGRGAKGKGGAASRRDRSRPEPRAALLGASMARTARTSPLPVVSILAVPKAIRPAFRARDQREGPHDAPTKLCRLAPVDGGAEIHLVRAGVARVAGEAKGDVRQRGGHQSLIFGHPGQGDHPAVAAAAGDLQVVVAQGSNLCGQDEGSVIGRLWHTRTNPELCREVESLVTLTSSFPAAHRVGPLSGIYQSCCSCRCYRGREACSGEDVRPAPPFKARVERWRGCGTYMFVQFRQPECCAGGE